MPWKEVTLMSQRTEFVQQALREGANISQLCKAFGISRKTGYKWIKRYRALGPAGLEERSHRPLHSPSKTLAQMEQRVLEVRQDHRHWGGRKIKAVLERGQVILAPAASTITTILDRHGKLDPVERRKHVPWQRFEMSLPNELWQIDHKGWFLLGDGSRCYPLTILDDHSRFLLGLFACQDEREGSVQACLIRVFRTYGLPLRMLFDNGPCWRGDDIVPYTRLTVWLLRLGIHLSHGRIRHPQTQGKAERLHRTFDEEMLCEGVPADQLRCEQTFDRYRPIYNTLRPHEALGLETPAQHYHPSPRPYPEQLPPLAYGPNDLVRKVDQTGRFWFHNRPWRLGKAFAGQMIALRPGSVDGVLDISFHLTRVATLDLRKDNGLAKV